MDWLGLVVAGLGPGMVAIGTVWFLSRRHPSLPPLVEFIRADPRLAGLTAMALLAPWFWPLLLLLIVLIVGLFTEHVVRRFRTAEWSRRAEAYGFTAFTVVVTMFLTAMIPVSAPDAPLSWGVALTDDDVPVWPATAEASWIEIDGSIISVTHVRMPGAVAPVGSAMWAANLADWTDQDDVRLRRISERLPGFIAADTVTIERTAIDSHEYSGEELRFERREVSFDILGERTAAEVLTVYRPMLGGEVRVLTLVEPGTGRFYSDPWAENTVEAWMSGS